MAEILDALLRRDRLIIAGGIALLSLIAWVWLLGGAGMGSPQSTWAAWSTAVILP